MKIEGNDELSYLRIFSSKKTFHMDRVNNDSDVFTVIGYVTEKLPKNCSYFIFIDKRNDMNN